MATLSPLVATPILAFGATALLMPALNQIARRTGFVDQPSSRKIHQRPIPLLGGMGIYVGVVISLLLLSERDAAVFGMMWAALLVMLLGVADDKLDLHSRYRLILHVALATGLSLAGIRFHLFPVVALDHLVTVLWIVGVINAMNCLDCADGAAGGTCLVVFAALAALAAAHGRVFVCQAALAGIGAVAGFLLYNVPPARVFMGDSGSTFLGLMAAVLAILAGPKTFGDAHLPLTPLVLAVPVFDIAWVHYRRYRAGIRSLRDLLASTGKDHLPHRLMAHGHSKTTCMSMTMLLSALAAEAAYGMTRDMWMGAIFAALALLFVLWYLEANSQVVIRPEDQVAIFQPGDPTPSKRPAVVGSPAALTGSHYGVMGAAGDSPWTSRSVARAESDVAQAD
jgi:UDP-GlcNAc:undecaprenyl-phosphate/decaprenyl-phosphate GlcNAc-1-phosphate transferase